MAYSDPESALARSRRQIPLPRPLSQSGKAITVVKQGFRGRQREVRGTFIDLLFRMPFHHALKGPRQ